MTTEAEKRIRAALVWRELHDTMVLDAADVVALLAELDRLRQWEVTGREWIDKTDWMQNGPTPARWLGKHRADALRDEINLLRAAIDTQPSPPTREGTEREPNEKQISDACLRYRHDFGLLDKYERDCIVNEARRWADAFGIGGSDERR